MTRLGGALVLGGAALGAAVAFGSQAFGLVGVGLLFAGSAARAWAGLAGGPVSAVQVAEPSPATEGEEVRLRLEVQHGSRVPFGSRVVRERLGRLGAYECRLRGHGRTASGEIPLGRLPRGRYVVSDSVLELTDPLGLEAVSVPLQAGTAVVVEPRLVELNTLFNDRGRQGANGRRLLLRRPTGFDFHSVREYEQGESLRRVHWPTTARRGQLMVKELEDAPRDAVAVLLDCDPAGAAGEPPVSSFDTAVRAAGSVLRAYATRGRSAVLITTGKDAATVRVTSLTSDFRTALAALAGAEPDAQHGLAHALSRGRWSPAQAGALVVVTATLTTGTVERLIDVATRRVVSVVWIDAPSFAGHPTRAAVSVLRLSRVGVPTAVVRRGDDLAAALEVPRGEARAYG